ncbi:MAG: hypothetical protein SWH61_17065 [Thermodesulfobacteriota bacterium]|nr:hypothetical protein [Thermodesulfobacteriota bacterium]
MKKIDIKEMNNWPKSWAGSPKDEKYGTELIKIFKPFIQELIDAKYSYRTIKNHFDNLWLLGGRVIKGLYYEENARTLHPAIRLTHHIDSWDGPRIYDLTESEQESFDRTCRKFYKHLVVNVLEKMDFS